MIRSIFFLFLSCASLSSFASGRGNALRPPFSEKVCFLLAEDRSITVPIDIISGQSRVVDAVLSHPTLLQDIRHPQVILDGVDATVFQSVLSFIQGEALAPNTFNLLDFIGLASQFEFHQFGDAIAAQMYETQFALLDMAEADYVEILARKINEAASKPNLESDAWEFSVLRTFAKYIKIMYVLEDERNLLGKLEIAFKRGTRMRTALEFRHSDLDSFPGLAEAKRHERSYRSAWAIRDRSRRLVALSSENAHQKTTGAHATPDGTNTHAFHATSKKRPR